MSDRWVTVAEVDSPVESARIKELLESVGIPAQLLDVGTMSMTYVRGVILVQVYAEYADRARAVLEPRRQLRAGENAQKTQGSELAEPDPDADLREGPDEPETRSSAREKDADRALRAAVIGVLILPVQAYVTWLLFRVWFSPGALDDRRRFRAWVAAAINLTLTCALVLIVGRIFWGWGGSAEDRIDLRAYPHPHRMVGVWFRPLDEAGEAREELELQADGVFRYRSGGASPQTGSGTWGYDDVQFHFLFRLDRLDIGEWKDRGRLIPWRLESLTDTEMAFQGRDGPVVYQRLRQE